MLKHYITVIGLLWVISLNAQTSPVTVQPFVIGESVSFASEILSEQRTLNVYLPEGYDKADSLSYPVIYLLDGSANEDFIHITGLVQFFTMLGMPKTIVIGIANVDRKRDFTFHTDLKELKEKYPTTGSSAKFMDFIEKELQPFVEKHYKTRRSKMIIGQSLGGLLATEILLKKPDLFTDYLIISPSLWWNNESLLKEAPALLASQKDDTKRVYISVGKEGKIMEDEARGIYDVLKKLGRQHLKIDFLPLLKEDHATILHQSIYDAFKLFYMN